MKLSIVFVFAACAPTLRSIMMLGAKVERGVAAPQPLCQVVYVFLASGVFENLLGCH